MRLHGGRFDATPTAGLEPGSPFGPNLCAFVLYLRFVQVIPFERLDRLMSALLSLEISERARANMLQDSAPIFAEQANALRAHLLSRNILGDVRSDFWVSDRLAAQMG